MQPEAAECLRGLDADEVWVPTEWHVPRFVAAGVDRRRLHVVPEPVDTVFYDRPSLPLYEHRAEIGSAGSAPFVFFSVFKWEARKGWDLLLRAYWDEFRAPTAAAVPRVRLVLKTYMPSWEIGPSVNAVVDSAAQSMCAEHGVGRDTLPPITLALDDASTTEMRKLYGAAHSFVLPTRGEGWGLPIVEAMAMGLAPIATMHSGPTAYLTPENGFPLPIAQQLQGGQAEPSVEALRAAMRAAYEERGTAMAARRSARARETALNYSRAAVAEVVARRLRAMQREMDFEHALDWSVS